MGSPLIARRVALDAHVRFMAGHLLATLRACPYGSDHVVWVWGVDQLVVEARLPTLAWVGGGLIHSYVERQIEDWVRKRVVLKEPLTLRVVVR